MTATATQQGREQATDPTTAIRPFRFEATDAELDELRRRITATRFPEKETVADPSQGVQLAFMQALARPDTGRHPRQHHPRLVDEHGRVQRSSLCGYKGAFFTDYDISVPAAVSVFPEEVYQAPRS